MRTVPDRPTHSPWQGWRLLGLLSLGLLLLAGAVLAQSPDVEGVRRVIRVTARLSFVLFLLAFTASAAAQRWPGPATGWLLRNRRYLGLGFVMSHAIHLAAIVAFASMDAAAFQGATSRGQFITSGLGYVAIIAMAGTSFDAAVRWLGPSAWRRLHWLAGHYIWLGFLVGFGKRVPLSPFYLLPVAVLLLALALRLVRRRRALSLA
jgi:sulfoxide reductase heme-binding subunit YedZ